MFHFFKRIEHSMNEEHQIMQQVLSKIKEYKRIILTRHIRPDGDAIGSSQGLREILRETYPDKELYVQTNDSSDYLSFLGPDDEPIDPEKYKDSLVIVLDTPTEERVSNSHFKTAKEVLKIDHHVDREPFGNLYWVEDYRSSTCEMIALFYQTFQNELKLTKKAAELIYTGMVTDTNRFRYAETKGETLRLAAMLLDTGIDIETLYSNLYLETLDKLKYKSFVYGQIQMTKNGVVYIYITDEIKKKFNLTNENAADVINFLNEIRNCIVQLAFIYMSDGTIRVRLRSRFMSIMPLANKFGGGGHSCACGATLKDASEIPKMVEEADKMVAEYKANNNGWL